MAEVVSHQMFVRGTTYLIYPYCQFAKPAERTPGNPGADWDVTLTKCHHPERYCEFCELSNPMPNDGKKRCPF